MTTRTLHLLPVPGPVGPLRHASDYAVRCCALAVRHEPDPTVCLLGGSGAALRASEHGIHHADVLTPVGGVPIMLARTLRLYLRARGPFDRVIAWSARSGRLAARAGVGDRTTTVLLAPPTADDSGGIGTARVRTLCDDDRDAWATTHGLVPEVLPAPTGFNPSAHEDSRCRARAELSIAPDELVIALLGDPETQADARRFIYLVGMVNIISGRFRGITPGRAREQRRAARFYHIARLAWDYVALDRAVLPLMPACDIAMVCDPIDQRVRPVDRIEGGLHGSLACAHASGVPVIGPRRLRRTGLYTADAADTCLFKGTRSNELLRPIITLHENRDRLRALSTELREHVSLMQLNDRFAQAWQSAIAPPRSASAAPEPVA